MDFNALSDRLRARLPFLDGLVGIEGATMPDPAPTMSAAEADAVEAQLGFALPPVLRHVYLTVGNGGFGPGYGLTGIGPGGCPDDLGETADQRYIADRENAHGFENWDWPEQLLSICDFGCAIYHCVDCATGEMMVWEPNGWSPGEPPDTALFLSSVTIEDWFDRWSRGERIDQYLWAEGEDGSTVPQTLADRRAGRRRS